MEKNNEDTDRVKKVVVIGPECTGKSSLSAALAEHYNTRWVPEYARQYIDELSRPYHEGDLLEIARGQIALEEQMEKQAHQLLICDTDLIVLKVWAEHKYQRCDQEILSEIYRRRYDLYLLTDIDIPWEDDPQRENPHLREYFKTVFEKELEELQVPFIKIKGSLPQRIKAATMAIDKLLNPS